MWTGPVPTSPPEAPVSVEEARTQCRVTGDAHDGSLNLYRGAAAGLVQKWTGLNICEQDFSLTCTAFTDEMALPIFPVQSVEIVYQDELGDTQTLDSAVYSLEGDTFSATIRLVEGQEWPAQTGTIRVNLKTGFTAFPEDLKLGCLLLVSHWFDNPSVLADGPEMPWGVAALLENYRTF